MASLVRSFLGEASLRIQRLLDLDALVSPKFDAQERIQPVIVLGDGDRPGMGKVHGRRWWAGGGGVQAAGNGTLFRLDAAAPAPLQVDRLVFAISAVSRIQIQLIFGAAGGVASNSYIDNAQAIEPVPGLFMVTSVVGAGTVIGQTGGGTNPSPIALDVLLTPNMGIIISCVSAVTLDCWLMGRSF